MTTEPYDPITPDRHMMATTAVHSRGDISRDTPDLAIIYGERAADWIGEWATGLGFVNVRFPKATTRQLTAEERASFHGKYLETGGMTRRLEIEDVDE